MSENLENWAEQPERWAHQRAQIKKILSSTSRPLDMAVIYLKFRDSYGYLTDLERIMELVKSGEVEKIPGSVPRYQIVAFNAGGHKIESRTRQE